MMGEWDVDRLLENMPSSLFSEWGTYLKMEGKYGEPSRHDMPVKRRRTAKELYEEIKANLIIGYKAKKVKR